MCMAEYHGPGMTVGGPHCPFYNTGHVLILPPWEGAPTKGQGVSLQRLSLSNYNKEEGAREQGKGKGDLFQLTIDEPQWWGARVCGLGWFI
jgi:hypothetical protein